MPQGIEFYLGQIVTALAIQIAQKAQEADGLREQLALVEKKLASALDSGGIAEYIGAVSRREKL